ncbi:IPT/TIG domain-containing protein [Cryobacterium sp. PH29-G1]|uniref:IPT/TIG domain-containing protein n=1 Tax=Cryobacterium sp. PH29-G1 TaxID=3046211 RepID=UPI0024BAACDD|nr:IPT/TIG domain-containing protein [Cryobacterium sp. PH29-G1]MDJ0350522.1 IPT/TIG domain-containing protein [Cryobacterium sp. PH29-G1]
MKTTRESYGVVPPKRSIWQRIVNAATSTAMVAAMLVSLPALPAQAATTSDLSLKVISARTESLAFGGTGVLKGADVPDFQYIINEDNTGTTAQRTPTGDCAATTPGYPLNCDWPSIKEVPHTTSPIVRQGDQADFASGLPLPDGRYLISVLADGYKIDGEHFSVPLPAPGLVTVELQPNPLPDSTLRAFVFQDTAPTNGANDQGEPGLAGFVGHVTDTLGELQTDVYGNPLCTVYEGEDPDTHVIPSLSLDGNQLPVPINGTGGHCVSDANGLLTMPHLGSNRYTLTATAPDGQTWIQTTTLEGNHDFDTWLLEGSTGYDTEALVAGEPVPGPIFGFVPPTNTLASGAAGKITGVVVTAKQYTPPKGGDFNYWLGLTGSKMGKPIVKPWLSLADLQQGDQAVWVGMGDASGAFDISGVPDGNYSLSWWDEPQNYFINMVNVTVSNGETVQMGNVPTSGWWTDYDGYVFSDTNRNGVKDPGEGGLPNFTLTMRKQDNSLMDRGNNVVTTDNLGYYHFESAYPLSEWTVMENYNDSFYTTGVTYQADNQPTPTTVKGAGVDVSVLSIIGLGGRMDWGVHAYDPTGANGVDPRNGGIVGSVSYDTTRNELDPQYAASEDWQPGVSDLPVELYATVDCGTHADTPCGGTNDAFELASDGSLATGKLLNTYVSEQWSRPTGCVARDVDGNPLVHAADSLTAFDENVLVPSQETTGACISSFMQGVQFGPYPTDQGTTDANFGAAVDGNYGFADACTGTLDASDPSAPTCDAAFEPLGSGDYLVRLAIPQDATGDPLYKVTGEEDINIGNGDQIVPQVPPPSCAGKLHTVDLDGDGTDNYPAVVGNDTNGVPTGVTVPASTPVKNATFLDIGGSPYEGSPKAACDTKLVRVNNGKSVVPMFNIFTDVPVPSRLRGLIVDDINFSTDPRSTLYGEKTGIAFAPVGIYDFANRLVTTLESDFNGSYDVLLPSTNHISCPTPSGVCTNMYRFVGNDPGIPGHLNSNYNPRYRSIATEFEAMPGVTIPTDLAPTQVGVYVGSPTTGVNTAVLCTLDAATPQLLSVSKPYVAATGSRSFTIAGTGFGTTRGTGQVTLGTTPLDITTWSDTSITASVPGAIPVGAQQLGITSGNGQSTINGLTFHVLGTGYSPSVREVGPGHTHATIQAALDAAFTNNGDDLVIVYPAASSTANPRGAYYENLVVASPVKLQGVGSGGFQGSTFVPGSIIDAGAFGGDTALAADWFTKVGGLSWDGNQSVNDGEGIYVLASASATTAPGVARQFTSSFKASIDGFDIRGGDQVGFPGNIDSLTGGPTGLPPNITTQGGAIFVNAYARSLQITNNVVQNNGGGYGTIRIGTPDIAAPNTNQHNENVRIANNRIIANAGTNLAGGIGLYAGSDGYEVANNDICGNFSMEYGGGLSVYGFSPGGKIHHNRMYFNSSNDEGGAIMIAGELPATIGALSAGSGPVDIYANQIQANLANDDGGGIRFLMAGDYPMNVYNNMIVNNVSTHEGGGIGINDAPNVRIYNNTIMKNLTTATAVTSNGQPAPAGLSTSANSSQLQATLPGGSSTFSNPALFNNIFWDNRAGTRAGTTVTGIGLSGATDINNWDLGVADDTGVLAPSNSVVQQNTTDHAYTTSPTNSSADPAVVSTYDVSVSFATWRQNPAFVDATLVTLEAPPNLLGNYHLANCPGSPACNLGAATVGGVTAPATDFDNQARPALGGYDSGADEFGSATTPPPPTPTTSDLYFSTTGSSNPPGVSGQADDADVYLWNGTAFSRSIDINTAPYNVPGNANLDGFSRVDATHFYASFSGNVALGGIGTVADEDVVYFDGAAWSLWFDGSAHGIGNNIDLGAVSVVGNTLYFSTNNNAVPAGAGGSGDNADVYRWNGGSSYTRVMDATTGPYNLPNSGGATSATNPNVDGLIWVDTTHFYLSFSNSTTTVPGLGAVDDEDVVYFNGTAWSLYFNGGDHGLSTSSNYDLDAIAFATGALPPTTPPAGQNLYFSTQGNTNPPGVGGTADDADVYLWNGGTFSRVHDVSTAPYGLPNSANVDGFDRIDDTHFYLSFTGQVNVPGIGNVQDEDVIYYNAGTWTLYFDGSAHGLGGNSNLDLDAISVAGTTLYFSTLGNSNPPGVGQSADNADIYSWNGSSYSRVVDASAAPYNLPGNANVDGFVRVDATHFYLSFSNSTTTVPTLGTVQDEDVIYYNAGTWSVYFDGTAHGLTSSNLEVDAFDLPTP